MKRLYVITALLLVLFTTPAVAQEESKASFDLGVDLVSSYVWRGAYQTSAAIQPGMGLSVGGFSLSAWASVPFSGEGKEVDFALGYQVGGFSIGITDYWWAGEGAYEYFEYKSHKTAHHFEAALGYTLPAEKFPLALSWSTMFAGEDYYKGDGKRAYSTYISAAYPFQIKSISLEAEAGITPWEGMYANEFSVVSVGLKASKEIQITNKFSVPVFGQVIANPKAQDIFFVFGISL
ncbi:hypothetical protein LJC21_02680 [Bacteroides sp. OttesenSCG-928-E20]|nr:hypothetical protein [Bacteroides sp. OttesenSCG-928-N06]MDL2299595.1 hypothetical protein [Bacteroides sp. OttesenSCG-928-E20]MDL2305314.1 hypothetical protein [Bacteroides sp. OttesenSCG-928-D19]